VKRFVAFFSLPASDRALLVEALAAVLLFRLALPLFSIDRLRAWSARLEANTVPSIDRVVWAAGAASRWTPGTTCLVSALALQRMLSVRGRPSELHIGVAKLGQRFSAHAWLISEGRIVIGEQGEEQHTPLTSWRSEGAADRSAAGGISQG